MPSRTKHNHLTVGLDIGTTKICAIAVESDSKETLNVVGVGTAKSEGLRKGVVVNIEKTVKSIKKAVEEYQRLIDYFPGSEFYEKARQSIKQLNVQ